MKRTKIICTIGPASDSPRTLQRLIAAGMDAARLNLSHNTPAYHLATSRAIRASARQAGKPVAILMDLQGPKVRVGKLPGGQVLLRAGDAASLPVTHALGSGVKRGDRVLMDDGLLEGRVLSVRGKLLRVAVKEGGLLKEHKGLNFPDSRLRIPSLTAKDKKDAALASQIGADWVALSFVTKPQDVASLRRLLGSGRESGKIPPRVMVKVEKHEAISRFDDILNVADGIMIARGDLGLEIPAEDVPVFQKKAVEKCRLAGKPVVVATQMLASMEEHPRPTRAEVSDVANAVFDHADAIMLSGETATGKNPVRAVQTMARIAQEAETSPYDDVPMSMEEPSDKVRSIAYAIKVFAMTGQVDAVVASIQRFPQAEHIFSSHPEVPFFLACPDAHAAAQANLRWGIYPLVSRAPLSSILKQLCASKNLKRKSRVLLVHGSSHPKGFEIVQVS